MWTHNVDSKVLFSASAIRLILAVYPYSFLPAFLLVTECRLCKLLDYSLFECVILNRVQR